MSSAGRVNVNGLREFPRGRSLDRVGVGIITIREDEFQAVLNQFPDGVDRTRGQREYTNRTLSTRAGNEYRLGIVRCLGQGNLEAKGAAEDLIRDLRPGWLLVVGIAGTDDNPILRPN
jgi:hypothetical protein